MDADEPILGPLAGPGEGQPIDTLRGIIEERPGNRELDRRRGRQPGVLGQAGRDHPADAACRKARLPERRGRRARVVDPFPARPIRIVEVEAEPFPVVEARQLDPPIIARNVGEPDLAIDRSRQDETLVVVGVLADEVDSTRRAHDANVVVVCRGRRFERGEGLDELGWLEGDRHP